MLNFSAATRQAPTRAAPSGGLNLSGMNKRQRRRYDRTGKVPRSMQQAPMQRGLNLFNTSYVRPTAYRQAVEFAKYPERPKPVAPVAPKVSAADLMGALGQKNPLAYHNLGGFGSEYSRYTGENIIGGRLESEYSNYLVRQRQLQDMLDQMENGR